MNTPLTVDHEPEISDRFPYEKRRIAVLDSTMSFVDEGRGSPILLVHGNPTSSYLWRNVIPHLAAPGRRVIAVDLIGMGDSGKPDIPYRFDDHVRYFDGFVDALGLGDLGLVLHDWGGGIGLDWAMRHPERVRSVVLMEAVVRPSGTPKSSDEGPPLTDILRSEAGDAMLMEQNMFVEQLLPAFSGRQLTAAEMDAYRAPFTQVATRKPIRRWIQELPLDGVPIDNHTRMAKTWAAFCGSTIPTLVLTAEPGAILSPDVVEVVRAELPRASFVSVGAGLHYLQETSPSAIGTQIARWLAGLRPGDDDTSGSSRT